MANKWLRHLANFRKQNRNIAAPELMKQARASYQQNGGNPNLPDTLKATGQQMKLKGGGVVPYEQQGTESTYTKVGGRRTKRQTRRSRRTRRR